MTTATTTCTERTTTTARYARTSVGEVLIARLTVTTHSSGLSGEQAVLTVAAGYPVVLGVEEAARLFGKMPGNTIRERDQSEPCDDADHDPERVALMEANAEADEFEARVAGAWSRDALRAGALD